MSKEYPPQPINENEIEAIHKDFEQVQEAGEAASEALAETPEFVETKRSQIKEEIEQAMAKKDTGAEPLETGFVMPSVPAKKESWLGKKWRNAMVTLGLVGAVAGGAQAADKAPKGGDSFSQGTEKMRTMEALKDSAQKSEIDMEKLESLGITGIEPVKQKDTTKEVYLVLIENFKSFNDVLGKIKKAGFEPSDYRTMDNALPDNKKLFENAKSIMALGELDGNKVPTLLYDAKKNGWYKNSREIGGSPEVGKGALTEFRSDEWDNYVFIVERPAEKSTTADYADFVKGK